MLAWLARLAWLLTVPFVRYEFRGARCAPDLKVGIIVANHRSMFDVVAGLIGLHHFRKYPRLLIERRYVEQGWSGPFARAIGAIPVDRGGDTSTALVDAVAALRGGVPLLIMPEGRLHRDPEDPTTIGPAKTGVSRLAVAAGVPVVPACVVGTVAVLPPGKRIPRLNPFKRKHVLMWVADDPIWLDGDDHRANTEMLMAEVRGLLKQAVEATTTP
jgi:1-acyl-sn-glycerol-3-phosphate acyltransferase